MQTELIYSCKRIRPTFGGQTIEVVYILNTNTNGVQNSYEITAEIAGIEAHDLRLRGTDAKLPDQTNEETLTREAALELFEAITD